MADIGTSLEDAAESIVSRRGLASTGICRVCLVVEVRCVDVGAPNVGVEGVVPIDDVLDQVLQHDDLGWTDHLWFHVLSGNDTVKRPAYRVRE